MKRATHNPGRSRLALANLYAAGLATINALQARAAQRQLQEPTPHATPLSIRQLTTAAEIRARRQRRTGQAWPNRSARAAAADQTRTVDRRRQEQQQLAAADRQAHAHARLERITDKRQRLAIAKLRHNPEG